jgi:hypothetical protein
MDNIEDFEEVIDLPNFIPESNVIDINDAKIPAASDIKMNEYLLALGIPIYDEEKENKGNDLSVVGINLIPRINTWAFVDNINDAKAYGIFKGDELISVHGSVEELVEHFNEVSQNASLDTVTNETPLDREALTYLTFKSGDKIEIDSDLNYRMFGDTLRFKLNKECENERFDEIKLETSSVYLTPETLSRLKEKGIDPEIIEKNKGDVFPRSIEDTNVDEISSLINQDGIPASINKLNENVNPNGFSDEYRPQTQPSYRQDMADVKNGADHLVSSVASLVGGGAALTGVLINQAGRFLKGISNKIEAFNSKNSSINEKTTASDHEEPKSRVSDVEPTQAKEVVKEVGDGIQAHQEPHNEDIDLGESQRKSKSVDDFLFTQMSASRDAYKQEIDNFWKNEKIIPIKEQIDALAKEQGVPVAELNQKISHDTEYEYIRDAIQRAVDGSAHLQDNLTEADSHLNDWIDTYEILKDKSERTISTEVSENIENELDKQKLDMEEVVAESPMGDGMFSKLEEFSMRIKEIVEKIREFVSKLTSGKNDSFDNSPSL